MTKTELEQHILYLLMCGNKIPDELIEELISYEDGYNEFFKGAK